MSYIQVIFVSVISAAITTLVTPSICSLGRFWGITERPEGGRSFRTQVPRCGGLAVVAGYAVAIILSSQVGWTSQHHALLAAAGLMALLGVIDDVFQLSPRRKLMGQVCIGLFAHELGFSLDHIMPKLPYDWLTPLVSIAWMVAITNAFNLIDGLDGLCSGLGAISAVALMGSAWSGGRLETVFLTMPLAASLLAFLKFNVHPASIILGDVGSLFIGFTLSLLLLQDHGVATQSYSQFFAANIMLGVPLLDTTLAIWRRSISPSTGTGHSWLRKLGSHDCDHIHHRLLRQGRSVRNASLTLWGVGAVFGGLSVMMTCCKNGLLQASSVVALLFSVYLLCRFGMAEVRATQHLFHTILVRLSPRTAAVRVILLLGIILIGGNFTGSLPGGEERPSSWFHSLIYWICYGQGLFGSMVAAWVVVGVCAKAWLHQRKVRSRPMMHVVEETEPDTVVSLVGNS